jgi:endo-1,4-beta-xylanase
MKFFTIIAAAASPVCAIKTSSEAVWTTQDHVSTSSLKEAAAGLGLYVGSALNQKYATDATYESQSISQFDDMTPENACKMKQIAKSYTELDFSGCIAAVEWAKANSMQVRAHNLIWSAPGHSPSFVESETDATKLEAFMEFYIKSAMAAIGDYPFVWDVDNEAVSNGASTTSAILKTSPWSIIDDHVCKAFQYAKKYKYANQKLFYNDYKFEAESGVWQAKSDRVYTMVKDLVDRDCGIDGVGFQTHIDITYDSFDGIKSNVARYAAIGMEVHFTEIDVRCSQFSSVPCTLSSPWPAANLTQQAKIYRKLLSICLSAPNCLSYETWGFTDEYSFVASPQDPFPLNSSFEEKPAYQAIYATLKKWNRTKRAAMVKKWAKKWKITGSVQADGYTL